MTIILYWVSLLLRTFLPYVHRTVIIAFLILSVVFYQEKVNLKILFKSYNSAKGAHRKTVVRQIDKK